MALDAEEKRREEKREKRRGEERRCDVCGYDGESIVARADADIRVTIAPWIKTLCTRCVKRYSNKEKKVDD